MKYLVDYNPSTKIFSRTPIGYRERISSETAVEMWNDAGRYDFTGEAARAAHALSKSTIDTRTPKRHEPKPRS